MRAQRRQPKRKTQQQNVRKIVKQEISKKIESKTLNSEYTIQPGWLGVSQELTPIVRGTDNGQYIGDAIEPTRIIVRISVAFADQTNLTRFMLVQVRSSAVPAANWISAQTGTAYAPLAHPREDNRQTFKILAEKLVLNQNVGSRLIQYVEFDVRGGLMKMNFTDAGAYEKGDIYLLAVSDSSVVSHPLCYIATKMYYKDA